MSLEQISTTAILQIRKEMYFIWLKITSKKSWLYLFPSALTKEKEESPTREEQHVTDINIRVQFRKRVKQEYYFARARPPRQTARLIFRSARGAKDSRERITPLFKSGWKETVGRAEFSVRSSGRSRNEREEICRRRRTQQASST